MPKAETRKDKHALGSGVEGTIDHALDVAGIRRARYSALPKAPRSTGQRCSSDGPALVTKDDIR